MRFTAPPRSAALTFTVLAGLILGGTVFRGPIADAAATISGSQLTDHSVPGKKLINDTLTGTQVKESTLGTVPNAAKLGGQSPSAFVPSSRLFRFSIAMAGQEGTAQIQPLGSIGSLTFNGHCQLSGSSTFSTIDATPTHEGVIVNGQLVPLGSLFVLTNDGTTANQSKTLDFAIVDPATGLTLDGQFSSVINTTGARCRLFGHLVRDGG